TLGNGSQAEPFRTISHAMIQVTAGDTVKVDAGSYGETVAIDTNSLALVGADSSATVLDFGDSTGGTAALGLFADTQVNLVVQNLRITNSLNGIAWKNVDQSVVEDVTVRANGNRGISTKQGSDTNIFNGVHALSNDVYGIEIVQSDSVTVQNSLSKNNLWKGYELDTLNNSTFTNNQSISNGGGSLQRGFELSNVNYSSFTNNVSNNNSKQGFRIVNSSNNNFKNNLISSNGADGISLSDTSLRNRFIRNTVRNNSGEGINLTRTASFHEAPDTNTFRQNRFAGNTSW
ncbi:MAG: right-handed parallel beta-helix repeat-containing protein, partial [bacterium]